MKRYALIAVLTLFCAYTYAEETTRIRANLGFLKDIKSNGKEVFELRISNDNDIVLSDLELTILSADNLEIILEKTKIDSIKPKETITIDMEVINNYKYYFSKDAHVTLKISNNEFAKDFRYKFTIKPVENFWFFIIMSITLTIIILFVIIFIKLNKGEKNAG